MRIQNQTELLEFQTFCQGLWKIKKFKKVSIFGIPSSVMLSILFTIGSKNTLNIRALPIKFVHLILSGSGQI